MGSRVRRPEVEVIPITQGDTLTVKKYLNAAEFHDLLRASARPVRIDPAEPGDVAMEIDPVESGIATVLAYLLDWTFTDFDHKPLVIRDQPRAVVRAALDLIDADAYMEVQRAIQAHDKTMRAHMAAEKKIPNFESVPA